MNAPEYSQLQRHCQLFGLSVNYQLSLLRTRMVHKWQPSIWQTVQHSMTYIFYLRKTDSHMHSIVHVHSSPCFLWLHLCVLQLPLLTLALNDIKFTPELTKNPLLLELSLQIGPSPLLWFQVVTIANPLQYLLVQKEIFIFCVRHTDIL